jgi:hypothetical protein
MAGPFDPLVMPPTHVPGTAPVALVVDTEEQLRRYLALGEPPSYVVVRTAADVPAVIDGMAILTDRELDRDLQQALVTALSATL